MQSVQISINTVEKVESFVKDLTMFEYDFELVSGRLAFDAKSIMCLGILRLDLSKPLRLNIYTKDNTDAIMDALSAYVV